MGWTAARRAPSAATMSSGRTARAVELGGTDKIDMRPGDCFVIETPGGGGFGQPAVPKAAE